MWPDPHSASPSTGLPAPGQKCAVTACLQPAPGGAVLAVWDLSQSLVTLARTSVVTVGDGVKASIKISLR